jgi:ElaB/YqjD/DUF883 family membrane-anchored ribosome-binding protein
MANHPRHSGEGHEAVRRMKDAASKAGEQARDAAAGAAEQAQDLVQRATDAASNLGERVEETKASVGGQMRSLADTIRERAPEEGMFGSAASALAETLETGGSYLEEQDLSAIAEDVAEVIRRHPITSVLVGVGVGFMLARTLRSL